MNRKEFSTMNRHKLMSDLTEAKKLQIETYKEQSKEFVNNFDYSKIVESFKSRLNNGIKEPVMYCCYLDRGDNSVDKNFTNKHLLTLNERCDILTKEFNKVNSEFVFACNKSPYFIYDIEVKFGKLD